MDKKGFLFWSVSLGAGKSAGGVGLISSGARDMPFFSPRICFRSLSVEDISFSVGKSQNPLYFISMDQATIIDMTPTQHKKMPYLAVTCQDDFVFSNLNTLLECSVPTSHKL